LILTELELLPDDIVEAGLDHQLHIPPTAATITATLRDEILGAARE
jgi:hypothetical protein